MWFDTMYGVDRTRAFAEIFPNATEFITNFANSGLPARNLTNEDFVIIYFLLVSEFANNPIRSNSEDRFKLQISSLLYQHAPVWKKETELQDLILALTEEEMTQGSKAIYNHALNPSTAPSTSSLEELTYIDQQNTTQYAKAKSEAYTQIGAMLDGEVSRRFIDKFRDLFKIDAYPDNQLVYKEVINK